MIIKKSRSQEDHVPGPVLIDTKCGEPTAIISTLSEQDMERLVDAGCAPAAAASGGRPGACRVDPGPSRRISRNHNYTFNFG